MSNPSSANFAVPDHGVHERGFFGHPRGLSTLFFTEMWERFSYYGMRALLVLFMTTPKEAGGLGFDVPTAGAVYAMYTALVYMTGVPGGWLADRFIGQRVAIFVGGIVIMLGHISLAMHGMSFFYGGLALIIFGTGLLKPNMSTMVGLLYGPDDKRRDGGFTIYYMGINIGAGLSPLVCGYLAQDAGFRSWLAGMGFNPLSSWHWGFAAAAVGMGFGLLQYLAGRKYLGTVGRQPDPPSDPVQHARQKRMLQIGAVGTLAIILATIGLYASGAVNLSVVDLSNALGVLLVAVPIFYFPFLLAKGGFDPVEKKKVAVLMILFLFTILFWTAFEQAGSSLTLFADRLTRNSVFGYEFPSAWWQAVNAVFILILAPVFSWLWVKLGSKEPSSPAKFSLGLSFVGFGFLVIATGAFFSGTAGARVSPMWLLALYFLHTVGELCLSPVGLSLVTKLAPLRTVSQLMGIWFFGTALGNFLAGRVAGLFEAYPLPQLFGALFLATAVAGLILALLIKPIRGMMGGVH